MNDKRENGIAIIAFVILVAIMAMLFGLCSCTTKKVVTEYITVHDTLHTYHTDTVSVERWNWRHDTLRIETERVVTLLQSDKSLPAETIRVETNNWHWQHEVVKDSASKVVARVDSILNALDRQRETSVTKTKPPISAWQYAIFLLIVGGVVVGVWKYYK